MVYQRMAQIGRVVLLSGGADEGKLAAIVNIIDGNRALVDGPCSGVRRQVVNFKNIQLTRFSILLREGARTGTVKKVWESAEISQHWSDSNWAKKLVKRQLRSNMTDFDRFKLMKAKQMRNRIVRTEVGKLRKKASKK